MRTIWETQEFRSITARNDEAVGVAVDMLLCAHTSLSAGSCAAVSRVRLKKLVFFETLQKFANVTLHNVGTNTEFAADFLDDLGFRPIAFQHSKDLGSHDVEGEHLAVMDVEDDGAIALVSASNSFSNLQQGVSPSESLHSVVNMGWRVPRTKADSHKSVCLFANQEREYGTCSQ
jgi:hypothetical protein